MKYIKNIINWFINLNIKVKLLLLCSIIAILVVLITIIWYKSALSPISKEHDNVKVTIEIGSSSNMIANALYNANVIKSPLAFRIYVKLNNITDFQAGEYTIDKFLSVKEIINLLKTGSIMKDQITITFVEGKNMRSIAKTIEKNTKYTQDDVFSLLKDKKYIDSLIESYWFLTKEIKNKELYYPLEGYLFPDTYSFDAETITIKEIFKTMLDKMDKTLTECDVKKSKLSIHDTLSLASIIELEGIDKTSRKDISSVLYNRLNSGMSLGSDVTTYYAYKIDMGERDLTSKELYTYNPYNTRGPEMFGKLPVGPICCPSKSSIEAAISPNNTTYLYFVADKNGKIYYANNLTEHSQIVSKLKAKDLWYEY